MPTLQAPGTGAVLPSLGQRASFRVLAVNMRLGFHLASCLWPRHFTFLDLTVLIYKAEAETQTPEARCSDQICCCV